MNDYKNIIKDIIIVEFSKILEKIKIDFKTNFSNKKNNFLLNQMDDILIANMVFVSTFESKSGLAIENVAKEISKLTFGEDNVPTILNPFNLKIKSDNIKPKNNEQLLVTPVDLHDSKLCGEITEFRSNNLALGKGKKRKESTANNKNIEDILYPLSKKYQKNIICTKPIDLIFFDGKYWNIFELKAGGNLDSSNAPANVEKLFSIYIGFGVRDARIKFATLYNKNGKNNTWTGGIKKHLAYPEMFLIGEDFWNTILPKGITYDDFILIYKDALQEIELNDEMQKLITNSF